MLRITLFFGTSLLRRITNQHVVLVATLYLLLPSFAYPGDPEDALQRLLKVAELAAEIESSHSYSYLIKEDSLIIGKREGEPPERLSMYTFIGRFACDQDLFRSRRAEALYKTDLAGTPNFSYAHDELTERGKSLLVDRRKVDVENRSSVYSVIHFNPFGLVFDSYFGQMNRIYSADLLLKDFKSFAYVASETVGRAVTDFWSDPNRHGIYEITYREGNGGMPSRVNYFYSPEPLPLNVKTVEDWRSNTEILVQNEANYVKIGDHFVPEHVEQITYQNRKDIARDEYVRSYIFVDWEIGTINHALLDRTNIEFPLTQEEFLELEKEISSK